MQTREGRRSPPSTHTRIPCQAARKTEGMGELISSISVLIKHLESFRSKMITMINKNEDRPVSTLSMKDLMQLTYKKQGQAKQEILVLMNYLHY